MYRHLKKTDDSVNSDRKCSRGEKQRTVSDNTVRPSQTGHHKFHHGIDVATLRTEETTRENALLTASNIQCKSGLSLGCTR